MAKSKISRSQERTRKTEWLKSTGLFDSAQIHRMRDFGEKRLQKEIDQARAGGEGPEPFEYEKPKRQRATRPATQGGNGTLLVFWKDETEQITGAQMKHEKQRMKRNQNEGQLLTDIFGSKAKGTTGYLKQKYGEIGITSSVIAYSDRDIQKYKKEYRGWTLIYNGKAIQYKDLLIVLNAAISQGVYQPIKKRNQAIKFINQVRQVNPKNGQRLMDDYKKYQGRGYYDEN